MGTALTPGERHSLHLARKRTRHYNEAMGSLSKEETLALVDEFPESCLNAARRYLKYLRDINTNPFASMEPGERTKLDASSNRGLTPVKADQS